jgi:hypothetical protein
MLGVDNVVVDAKNGISGGHDVMRRARPNG